jgi:precorrin-8X/cobalt-precorrin-8 methylmutase
MTLVHKYALLPDEIDRQSLVMVAESLTGHQTLNQLDDSERYVLHRIVRAEGDPNIAADVRFSDGAVASALASLGETRRVVTDVRMVQVGISRAALARRSVETACLIDAPEVAERARREGTTRSVAAVRELAPLMNGSVVAIGNAPTALLALLDLIDTGQVSPAVVVGMPVGFVACPESKQELAARAVPHITILGRRGGSSAAAATVNALLDLLGEES